jgi:cardiolipin synthase (CMP-forming)
VREKTEIYNLPNLVSLIRLLMAPVLVWLALNQQHDWFIVALVFTVFTDLLDGFLARALNQITEMGSRLDSWGDFVIYSVMAFSAWVLWPEIVIAEKYYFAIILMSFTLPVFIGLLRFKTLTSYHTWSVKLAVGVTIVAYVLLFSGMMDWVFKLAAVMCAYAAIEEIMISFILHNEHVDVRTVWHAIRINKQEKASNKS